MMLLIAPKNLKFRSRRLLPGQIVVDMPLAPRSQKCKRLGPTHDTSSNCDQSFITRLRNCGQHSFGVPAGLVQWTEIENFPAKRKRQFLVLVRADMYRRHVGNAEGML